MTVITVTCMTTSRYKKCNKFWSNTIKAMLRLYRNFDLCEIGRRQFNTPGRPLEDSEREWVMRCNFVFKTISVVKMLSSCNKTSAGWLIEVYKKQEKPMRLHIPADVASSTALLKKVLMREMSGSVARLTSEDFLDFVTEDVKNGIRNTFTVDNCGKNIVNDTVYWVFPNIVLNSRGEFLKDPCVMYSKGILKSTPFSNSNSYKALFSKLGEATREFFGPRSVHALHVYSSALKAILREELLNEEHMVSITNISGPPNVGKTLASSVVLSLLSCPNLMLSRCTTSSLLDKCHYNNSLMVVWDDPRDTTVAQMCSIIHEAFHGHSSSTISKGMRNYNSSIIIGTQQKLLGLSPIADNIPTLSRVSHVDMDIDTDFTPRPGSEKCIAECMEKMSSALSALITQKYNVNKTDKMHKRLNQITGNTVLDRSTRIAAIDWNLCQQLNDLGCGFSSQDIAVYFEKVQMNYLSLYCNKRTPFQRFLHDLKRNVHMLPSQYFKPKIVADLKSGVTCECVALYLRGIFPILEKEEGALTYTMETIQKEVKSSKSSIGDIAHNVSFKTKSGNIVQRALVIRHDVYSAK